MIKAAVLGSPIEHSLSPVVHGFIYRALGLEYEYSKIELEVEGALEFIPRELEKKIGDGYLWRGFSLTMPLKEVGFHLGLEIDSYATRSISINTIIRGKGFNTDVTGAMRVLSEKGIAPKKILILGNGATARSMAIALEEYSLQLKDQLSISIIRRNNSKDQFFLERNNGFIEFLSPTDLSSSFIRNFDLTISTLPATAGESMAESFEGYSGTLFDVSYQPWPSPLASKTRGETISGIDLLVAQAVDQAAIFSGLEFDHNAIFRETLLSTTSYILKKR
jgi:shikimate dehydrogenase